MRLIALFLVTTVVLGLTAHDLKFADEFEPLTYPTGDTESERARRALGSLDDQKPLLIRFDAHNRSFHLLLRPIAPASYPFVADTVVDQNRTIQPHHFLYEGRLEDDPQSRVFGSIINGVFDGHIYSSDGTTYTVEKCAKFYADDELPAYHSMIFRDLAKMEPAVSAEESSADAENATLGSDLSLPRSHRSIRDYYDLDTRRSCGLHLVADLKLYNRVFSREGFHSERSTRWEIISMFYTNIRAVNDIFSKSEFNGTGIKFAIKKITIFTPKSCQKHPDSVYCRDEKDGQVYIDQLSKLNHSDFCLVYAMTYSNFQQMLGVAFLAEPTSFPGDTGGFCAGHERNFSLWNYVLFGTFQNDYVSMNVGLVTLHDHEGERLSARKAQLTLAHELGHSLGADHDDDAEQFVKDRNIMFPMIKQGQRVDKASFSTHSVNQISKALEALHSESPSGDAQKRVRGKHRRNCLE